MMTELMLGDTAKAHDLRYVALRYFNVAGADHRPHRPIDARRKPTSSRSPARAATGRRDGSTFSEWIIRRAMALHSRLHSWKDLALAHSVSPSHLESSGPSQTLNCGYSRGFSVPR